MDEIKIIEETTESETTPDVPVAEQSVTIDVGTQTVASDTVNAAGSANATSDEKTDGKASITFFK